MAQNERIVTTVAFTSKDREAFDALWSDLRTRYKFFHQEAEKADTEAFAVSMGDLFAQQEAIEAICNHPTLDDGDKVEAIGEVVATVDLAKTLADWGVEA